MEHGDDVEWLTPEQLEAWIPLLAAVMTLQSTLDAQLKRDAGLNTFEYSVLATLSESPERTLPMSFLAHLSQGSISRLSHAVTRLASAGWVVRRSVAGPGRRTNVELTALGMAKLEESAPGHVNEVRHLVIDALTPDQLSAVGDAAQVILAAVDPALSEHVRARHPRSSPQAP